LAVDLKMAEFEYKDDLDEPECKDTSILENIILETPIRFHKSEIIKGMAVSPESVKDFSYKISEWVLKTGQVEEEPLSHSAPQHKEEAPPKEASGTTHMKKT